MYKVFVNDCLIILTENKNISTKLLKVDFNSCVIEKIIQELFQSKEEGICLVCSDLKRSWKQFKSHFKIEKAAGGKVLNKTNDVLFIYRFDKWDLPKGKLEKGESKKQCAIREVEEECGISNLLIQDKLETTYHIFERNEKIILKITYWYLMSTNYNGVLTPQIEEGIEQVVFKNEAAIKQALKNTYGNIQLLF
jgi:ADP-ribose pyrophosphatase YjhB (NUDIX family)